MIWLAPKGFPLCFCNSCADIETDYHQKQPVDFYWKKAGPVFVCLERCLMVFKQLINRLNSFADSQPPGFSDGK